MGIEIDKVSNGNVARNLAELNKISSQIHKTEEEQKKEKIEKNQEKKEPYDAHLDTYKKHAVSNSIEQQIKEQEAKISELKKNLEGLRETYDETWDARAEAKKERYLKERDLYKKEVSERSLKNLFQTWKMKYFSNKTDKSLETGYHAYGNGYDSATDERRLAEKDYDIADAAAFDAIMEHNEADSAYLAGLWKQQDAYWDLASMQKRLMLAKHIENLND